MQETCLECGAPTVRGMNCREQLETILAWEYQDPELLSLHFFTVALYNLQHPASFTEEAVSGLITLFKEALDEQLPNGEIRRRAAARVKKPVKADRPRLLRTWPGTIADVTALGPEGAAERVRAWAVSVREALA